MDPSRKRRIRLGVALSTAVLLAAALVYTSFSASSEAVKPSQLVAHADPGRSYHLTGKVVNGSIHKAGGAMYFKVRDRDATSAAKADKARRVAATSSTFVGAPDSLITKCPSKFAAKKQT